MSALEPYLLQGASVIRDGAGEQKPKSAASQDSSPFAKSQDPKPVGDKRSLSEHLFITRLSFPF